MLLKIDTEADGDTLRVRLAGEFDLTAIDDFRRQVENASIDWRHAEVDLRDVVFMDSSGLQALVSLNNRARERGRVITLVSVSEPVARLLALTGLDGQFTVRD